MNGNGAMQPDESWYDEFYVAAAKSRAYSEYCKELFGYDFTQQGFCGIAQIESMLEILRIVPGESVLDIGCGSGKMLEYICDKTGATGYGFDISHKAIEQALERTIGNALRFEQGDINTKQYAQGSFDAVLAVDTAYFTEDLESTFKRIYGWLKDGGRLAVFYSAFRFLARSPMEMLTMHGTELAKALCAAGIEYSAMDFTHNYYEHMKKKRIIISGLKERFEAEGTELLYKSAYAESTDPATGFDEFSRFSARYLYIAHK